MKIELVNLTTQKNLVLSDEASNFNYVLDAENTYWESIQGTNNTTKLINLIGCKINSTYLEPREVVITGWVVAENQMSMTHKKGELNRFFNPLQKIQLNYEQYKLEIKPSTSIRYSKALGENNEVMCKFMVQCVAENPLFRYKKDTVYYESAIQKTPLFPLIVPKQKGYAFGYIPAVSINNVPNEGDIESGFIVRFIAENGAVTNPKITNNKTGKYIETIITMSQNDILEISTIPLNKYAVLIRNGARVDVFNYVTVESNLDMTLSVGINDLSVDAGNNVSNLNTTISFSPEFLEVQ